jgi:hypothetical protein
MGANDTDAVIRAALDDQELSYQRARPGAYLVRLEGTRKLVTMTWLVVGRHSLLVEAFVVRRPEENVAEVHRYLLARNARMYGVAFSVDVLGDVYLVGRLPLSAVSPEEIDRLLGCVLTYADESFNPVLEIGFGSSIRREWEWRRRRGENTTNLAAFARFAQPREAAQEDGPVRGPTGGATGTPRGLDSC